MGYAGGGVGNLDVSNSDTTAYKDTTNPVTSFFAPGANQTYAFNRSVVAFSANGSYTDHTDPGLWRQQWPLRRACAERPLTIRSAIRTTDRERRPN